MRISGTESSSVILRQSSLKSDAQKRQNKVKPRCSQKRYKSSGVDRRTWLLYVPSGTPWFTSSDTHRVVKIPKETSTQMYTPFLPSSVILRQRKYFKMLKSDAPKWQNNMKPKAMM